MQQRAVILLGVAMVALIVTVDVLFLRDHFWPRLLVNVGIVLAFAGVYAGFRRRH